LKRRFQTPFACEHGDMLSQFKPRIRMLSDAFKEIVVLLPGEKGREDDRYCAVAGQEIQDRAAACARESLLIHKPTIRSAREFGAGTAELRESAGKTSSLPPSSHGSREKQGQTSALPRE